MSTAATPVAVAAPKKSFWGRIKTIVEDAGKVIGAPITFAEKAEKVLATAVEVDPELKATLTTLVTKAEAIASASTVAVAGDGINFAADAADVADVEAFFVFVKTTLVPQIEAAYEDVKTDVAS